MEKFYKQKPSTEILKVPEQNKVQIEIMKQVQNKTPKFTTGTTSDKNFQPGYYLDTDLDSVKKFKPGY